MFLILFILHSIKIGNNGGQVIRRKGTKKLYKAGIFLRNGESEERVGKEILCDQSESLYYLN